MAGALEEMQSEGMADQVFHRVSEMNGSIKKEKDDDIDMKVSGILFV